MAKFNSKYTSKISVESQSMHGMKKNKSANSLHSGGTKKAMKKKTQKKEETPIFGFVNLEAERLQFKRRS